MLNLEIEHKLPATTSTIRQAMADKPQAPLCSICGKVEPNCAPAALAVVCSRCTARATVTFSPNTEPSRACPDCGKLLPRRHRRCPKCSARHTKVMHKNLVRQTRTSQVSRCDDLSPKTALVS